MARDPFSRMSDDRVISRGGPVEIPQIADGGTFGFKPAPTTLGYPNPKVDALLAGSISLSPGTFTERDFLDLALAALDQAGVSVSLQRRVNELVADEIEDAKLHVQPCGFGLDGAPCYGCELSAKAVR
ncbi:MAG: hypothetical protein AB7E70_19615 [Hyphomicrobiaceae bacterium]